MGLAVLGLSVIEVVVVCGAVAVLLLAFGGRRAREGLLVAFLLLVVLGALLVPALSFFGSRRSDMAKPRGGPPRLEQRSSDGAESASSLTSMGSAVRLEQRSSDGASSRPPAADSTTTSTIPSDGDVVKVPTSSEPAGAPGDAGGVPAATPAVPPGETPDWIKTPMRHEYGTDYRAVKTDPVVQDACDQALNSLIQEKTQAYIAAEVGEAAAALFTLELPFIRKNILQEQYYEPYESASPMPEPMYVVHALLAFGPKVRDEIRRRASNAQSLAQEREHEALRARRLGWTAGVASIVMAVLATVFAYLKLDTLTKGYYTRRLQLAAVVVILAIGGLAVALVDGLSRAGW